MGQSRRPRWPTERPIRTIIGFLGIALGAKVVHRVRYERVDHIPSTGPAIVVANHLSATETLALARLITGHHRFPHFLAKAEAFTWPIVGRILRAARQIPVFRGSERAADSLAAASREIERGHVVCLYPEGHFSSTPDLRPGPGKTGAARLALTHPDVPVIPVGMGTAAGSEAHLAPAPGPAGGGRTAKPHPVGRKAGRGLPGRDRFDHGADHRAGRNGQGRPLGRRMTRAGRCPTTAEVDQPTAAVAHAKGAG